MSGRYFEWPQRSKNSGGSLQNRNKLRCTFFLSKEQTGKTGSPAFSTSNRASDRSQTASHRHFSNRNRPPHARYDIHSQPARSSLVRFPFALIKEEAGYNLANFRIEILPPSNHCESNPPGLCLFVCLSPNHYPITCRTLCMLYGRLRILIPVSRRFAERTSDRSYLESFWRKKETTALVPNDDLSYESTKKLSRHRLMYREGTRED